MLTIGWISPEVRRVVEHHRRARADHVGRERAGERYLEVHELGLARAVGHQDAEAILLGNADGRHVGVGKLARMVGHELQDVAPGSPASSVVVTSRTESSHRSRRSDLLVELRVRDRHAGLCGEDQEGRLVVVGELVRVAACR